MFTMKPQSGETLTKLVEGPSDKKGAVSTTVASKGPRLSSSKMVPSIIGEDLTIIGKVTSKGEIQIDGEIEGDIHCSSLLLGEKSQVKGGVIAEDVVVRGHMAGSIRGLRVTLQAPSHVEGDIFHQSLAIEQGAYFEGKARRSDNPVAEVEVAGSSISELAGSANSSSTSVSSPSALPSIAAE
jgi:cytoskeletal protein CcmA (bactofilin family)